VILEKSKFTPSFLVNISYKYPRMSSPFLLKRRQICHLASSDEKFNEWTKCGVCVCVRACVHACIRAPNWLIHIWCDEGFIRSTVNRKDASGYLAVTTRHSTWGRA